MNRDEILSELGDDVLLVLRDRKLKQDERVDAICKLVDDLLAPGSVAAVEVVGARTPMTSYRHRSGTIEHDGNGDLVRVTFDEPVDIEWHGRQ